MLHEGDRAHSVGEKETHLLNLGEQIVGVTLAAGGFVGLALLLRRILPSAKTLTTERSQRKSAEERLLRSEARFRVLIEQAPEAIAIIDAQTGLYVEANPAAEKLHGLPREQIVNKRHPWDFSPDVQPNGKPSVSVAQNYLDRALAGENPKFEWLHLDQKGNEQDCEVSLTLLPTQSKSLIRACVYDMTEHKRAAQALRKSQRAETLTLVTGGAAHDFKNLLAAIESAVQLLDCDSETDRELKAVILKAARRGSEFTHRLLDYSSLGDAETSCTNLSGLLSDLSPMLAYALGAATEIRFDVAPDLWSARIDPSHLEDALVNLAFNARDAMGDKGQIVMHAHNVTGGADSPYDTLRTVTGDYIAIDVSDSGAGMSKELREQAFKPFFTTKAEGKGTGLGLPMVQHFISQSNGLLDMVSQEGVGTTITLLLPKC